MIFDIAEMLDLHEYVVVVYGLVEFAMEFDGVDDEEEAEDDADDFGDFIIDD